MGQEAVANQLGFGHSDAVAKLAGLAYTAEGSDKLISGASVTMVVEVLDVLHLPVIEEESFVYGLSKTYTLSDAPMLCLLELR